ncbi:uncharacterized protein LY79DRAFT_679880 [Colletotrichum navitas]|uniref:DUF7918 domain-containing protein n=1 Tax=Colletotrichum navitas TaxID=681940 RepID=A0AAD8V7R1_9PEZI|nr:uncharacterized protein LY79DRAFT_679880 [Colletotrichum navitas]KAK1596119.1 hypothetical protein LY79DRAFT_679880 [Colletotrichum navitas]
MNGQKVVEHDDPDAIKTAHEAPLVCCKLIEIKGGASFSIDILLGRGIRDILASDDSALMAVVHLDSQEVIRRLVTKKTLGSGKARKHRLLLEGVHEKDGKSRPALKRFRFATSDKNGNIPKGSIKVDVYIVNILSQPERGQLVDITSSGPPPQAIVSVSLQTPAQDVSNFEPNKTKKSQAANTYDINRLNHGNPLASFIFKYQTKTTKLFDDLTLSDSEEEKTEMNRLYSPLQPKGFLAEMGEKNDHAKTENDKTISIQSGHDMKSTVPRKRKAVWAFDESSPPRPRKVIALSE